METHIYIQMAGIMLLFALFGLLAMWNVYTTNKYLTHAENKPSPSPLSSLKVGDYFIIVDDEEELWEVLQFGFQGVFVESINTGHREWLKYDLKIQKFPITHHQH